jgi:hypothetical protein
MKTDAAVFSSRFSLSGDPKRPAAGGVLDRQQTIRLQCDAARSGNLFRTKYEESRANWSWQTEDFVVRLAFTHLKRHCVSVNAGSNTSTRPSCDPNNCRMIAGHPTCANTAIRRCGE